MRSLWSRSVRRRRRVHRTRLALRLSRLRRSTAAMAAMAAVVATLAGLTASGLLDEAAAARDRWGRLQGVDVVVREVRAGTTIAPGDVREEGRPSALLPAGATRAGSAIGRTALVDLVPGDVVADARLATDLVPSGWLALAVPPPGAGAHPELSVGDRVEVLDVGAADSTSSAPGVVVAIRAEDGVVTIAVARADAPAVAFAATAGTAVLAVSAARPPR